MQRTVTPNPTDRKNNTTTNPADQTITTTANATEPRITTITNTTEPDFDHNPARVASRNLFDIGVGTDNLFRKDHFKTTLKLTATNIANKAALYNFLSTFSGTHFVQPRAYQVAMGFVF